MTGKVAEQSLVDTLARAVAARYATAVRAADRLDALDGRSGALASEELRDDPAAAAAAARELVARLLRIAAEARLEPVLRSLEGGPRGAREVAASLGLHRLAMRRRVDEMVDAGLAEYDPNTDRVQRTPLGTALVAIVDDLAATTAAAIREAVR